MIEIKPIKNLDAEIKIHGSKSYTQRALITAALAEGKSKLINAQICDDSEHMIQALKEFGADIIHKNRVITVNGVNGKLKTPTKKIFAGDAGTTMRFLTTLASLTKGETIISCGEQMQKRPIKDIILALQQQGVDITSKNWHAPLRVRSNGLKGGIVNLKGDVSSQYLSSLILSGPYTEKRLEINLTTPLVSKPYVNLTLDVVRKFGGKVVNKNYKTFLISNKKKYKARKYLIEGDYSNASYFFAAAAITNGRIRVKGLSQNSLQGDYTFLNLLQRMGCTIKKREDYIEVTGGELKGVKADLKDCPDIALTLAVVSVFAKGKTEIRSVNNLKFKETNRIKALINELKKIGVQVTTRKDKLIIKPQILKPAEIETYNDHRMAMSFAIAGLKIPGIKIRNPECINKSFPEFFQTLEALR
jgi:3-phosphoshikimate 1-carboxyvinyltransferase